MLVGKDCKFHEGRDFESYNSVEAVKLIDADLRLLGFKSWL